MKRKKDVLSQTGSCPHCGAPIFYPMNLDFQGDQAPAPVYSCECRNKPAPWPIAYPVYIKKETVPDWWPTWPQYPWTVSTDGPWQVYPTTTDGTGNFNCAQGD